MRILLPRLFLLLLIIASPATCSTFDRAYFNRHPRGLGDSGKIQLAKRLLKAEVPERLKDWKLFQDGSRLREGIRSKYIAALKQFDKINQPYPYASRIKKEWTYEPDLRRHYVVPRVLRVPLILQDDPFRYKKETMAFIKGTDEELGLQEVAKPHLPEIIEGQDAGPSSADAAARLNRETSSQERRVSRRTFSRRPSRNFQRQDSFNQFRAGSGRDNAQPRTPVPEIESEEESSSAAPSGGEANVGHQDRQPPSSQAQTGRQAPVVEPVSNILVEMGDNYRELQKLQEEQIQKAAMRYPGHPEYLPPLQQDSGSGRAAHGASVPVHSPVATPQSFTPEQSQRRFYDPTGAEGDISNPITPDPRTPGTGTPQSKRVSPGWARSPEIRSSGGGDPSPLVSTPGGWTPESHSGTGFQTPLTPTFRLPADYADRLHAARVNHGSQDIHRGQAVSSVTQSHSVEPGSNQAVSMGWSEGRPSSEALRRVQEAAAMHGVDYAIYNDEAVSALKTPAKMRFARVHPHNGEDRASNWQSVEQTVGGAVTRDEQAKPPADESSSSSALRVGPHRDEAVQTSPKPSQSRESDVEMKDASSWDEEPLLSPSPPLSPANAPNIDEASSPAKKRKRPPALLTPLQRSHSFLFPTANTELNSPHLKGFKPSLSIKEEPNPHFDPGDPGSSPGLVFRRQRLSGLVRGSPGHVRKARERLQSLPSLGVPREMGAAAGRGQPQPPGQEQRD